MQRLADLPQYKDAMETLQQQGIADILPIPEDRAKTAKYSDLTLLSWGYVYWRELQDGALYAVLPLSFGKGRVCKDLCKEGYTDFWSYDSVLGAIHALKDWEPMNHSEISGWTQHHPSNRRRVKGDPSTEHVDA
ncbi:hypothetical protein RYA05_13740 [Pseudomonas syringae pv. actinidiae]|nr:hypothetical protein [Pseudomonas syringae pv. actinidiae]